MPDELELDLEQNLDLESDEEKQRKEDRALKRNKDLSDKLKAEAEARQKAEEKAAKAEKEASFFKNFNPLISKYQNASEFQDQIKERVMKGYDMEEATLAVLAKEGKYTPPPAPEPPKENPAGGSADNALPPAEEKPLTELSREEKKSKLEEVINKGEIRFGGL